MSEKNTLTLPSDPSNLSHVEPLVGQVAERYKIAPETHDNMLLSLTEAVVNAIMHGNRGDCSKKVRISLHKDKNSIAFRVSDEGRGFDPANVPDPTSPERLEMCGGRDVFLMKNLSDQCRFMNGGSTVEMKWRLGG